MWFTSFVRGEEEFRDDDDDGSCLFRECLKLRGGEEKKKNPFAWFWFGVEKCEEGEKSEEKK